jgi:hypothetical protein
MNQLESYFIYRELKREIKKGFQEMSTRIDAFKTAVDAAFVDVNTKLDNVVSDEANLADQINKLQAQLVASGDLSPEDQATLAGVVTEANALVARTTAVADNVPDTVNPPAA